MNQRSGRLGIGIIGAGRVGPVLGAALGGAGHAIVGISTVSEEGRERADVLLPGVPVLTVPEVKGLEFDSVIVADPAGIIKESERGLSDLYVALTRSTQRLAVVHTGELPVVLRRLQDDAA